MDYFTLLSLSSLSFAYREQAEIRILHMNDSHGFAELH
jgi:2',3'-cyclic-nucleotide 2'-phosphodiesterase (5'-nucleotidase family)